MKPTFGWTQLSTDELRRVEDELAEQSRGVRDELGFLVLHQLYADRFFPGTSVLLTRLRYVLFVPWMYADAAAAEARNVRSFVQNAEQRLTRRLLAGAYGESGIIGRRTYPGLPSQPAASIYWNTLGRWGILRGAVPGESFPSRGQVERRLATVSGGTRIADEDGVYLESGGPRIFVELPSPPADWADDEAPLDFALSDTERAFLRTWMGSIRSGLSHRSLLGDLVSAGVTPDGETSLWDEEIFEACDSEDHSALERSLLVAAASCVGRALYTAVLETVREEVDGLDTPRHHREILAERLSTFGDAAASLNVDGLYEDGEVSAEAIHLLELVVGWCTRPTSLLELRSPLADIEVRRKGWRRARLQDTRAGLERRAEWTPTDHPPAEPLHYRWPTVRALLGDLNR